MIRAVFFLALAIGFTSMAYSNRTLGWSTSGGEGIGFELNPWFLENTLEVNYCIQIGENDFSMTKEDANIQVKKAVAFWKNDFSFAAAKPLPGTTGQFAIQEWKLISKCGNDVDVAFHFGTTKVAEEAVGRKLEKLIAAAILDIDNYDPVHLRGKGVLYVSPDIGKNRSAVPEGIWSKQGGWGLKQVLIHELGHIYGIAHQGVDFGLMGAGYPRFVASLLEELPDTDADSFQSSFFEPRTSWAHGNETVSCLPLADGGVDVLKLVHEAFSVSSSNRCLQASLVEKDLYQVKFSKSSSSEIVNVGEIKIHHRRAIELPVIRIGVDDRQEFFPDLKFFKRIGFYPGPAIRQIHESGTFYPQDKSAKKAEILILRTPDFFQLGGVVDGRLYPSLITVQ